MKSLLVILFTISLIACSKNNVDYSYPDDPENKRKNRAGKFFKDDIVLYGKEKSKEKVSDNKLFASAQRVIAQLIELDVVDSDLGIITTKWQKNIDGKEKTKINASIKGSEAKEENINISIHKRSLKNGKWHKKKSGNEDFLIKLLKEKILARAQ